MEKALEALGLGNFDEASFPKGRYYCQDWADTTESQRLLKYQRLTYDDWIEDLKETLKSAEEP